MSRERSNRKRSRDDDSDEYGGEIKKLRALPPENRIIDSKLNEDKTSQIIDMFTFGANEGGQLGIDPSDAGSSPKLQYLKQVSDLNNISYSCSNNCTFVVEVNDIAQYRNVYSWGGDESVLARNMDDDSWTPSRIEYLHEQPLVQIACGESHAVALTSTGEVVSWGIYKRKGKPIGFRPHLPKEDYQDVPEIMAEIEEEKIVQVACTNNRSLALTETGDVYEWGNTRLDNRTLKRHVKDTLLPSKVLMPSGYKIVAIYAEANGGSIFAEATDGTILAWGNNQYYQCGIDEEVTVAEGLSDEKAGEERARVKKEKIATHSRPTKAKQINTILEDEDAKVKKISSGRLHSVLLTESGDVFTWGDNTKGQLGLEGVELEETITVPTRVSTSSKIVDIASGPFHTLLLTEDGDVYGFGANKDRCLGSLDDIQSTPAKIKLTSPELRGKIVGVACGSRHNLIVASAN